jgi:hypothetical protein
MGQLGFFDLNRRYESLDEKNDPLVAIAAMVPFESFRSKLKAALIKGELRTSDATRKSLAGRKPWGNSLAIFERLARSDPGNAGWQRDLSVSYEKSGDVQGAQGNLKAALKSYSDGLAIAERVAPSDPNGRGARCG